MVKLVRLKTNNKDGIFDCRFDDNIKLKPNAEIALKNISFHQNLVIVTLNTNNGQLTSIPVSGDGANNYATQNIEGDIYSSDKFPTLLQEIENALNRTLSCSNQIAQGKPDQQQLFSSYRVFVKDSRVTIIYRLSFAHRFELPLIIGEIPDEFIISNRKSRKTIALKSTTTATNSTRNRLVALEGVEMSKGSGVFGVQIYSSVNAAAGQEEYNGFILGLSIENKRNVIGGDNTTNPRVNDDDPNAEIAGGARNFEIDFRQGDKDYRFRIGGLIKNGTAPTLQDSGVLPSNVSEIATAGTLSGNDIVQLKVDTMADGSKNVIGSVIKQTTTSSGFAHEVILFHHALTDEDLGFNSELDAMNLGMGGLSDFRNNVLTPYLILRGNENNIVLSNTTFTPDETINASKLDDSIPGDDLDPSVEPYFSLNDENQLNDATQIENFLTTFVNGNNGLVDDRDRHILGNNRTSTITLSSELERALGGSLTKDSGDTFSLKNRPMELITSEIDDDGLGNVIQKGLIGATFNFERISDFIARDFYMIEALNLNLDSFNSVNDVKLNIGNNGERKNILSSVANTTKATEDAFIAYEPNEAHYIDIKNNTELNIRELKFRIVDENFDPVLITGNANMTILLKD